MEMVEHRGLEPLTPTLPVWCAPNCANAPGSPFYEIPLLKKHRKAKGDKLVEAT